MSERASHTNWQQSITGHKSNSGGRKGRKQAEKPTLTEQGIDVDESSSAKTTPAYSGYGKPRHANANPNPHTGRCMKHGWNNPKQAIHQNAA